jgi:superfamily II DNA or RNA helicase
MLKAKAFLTYIDKKAEYAAKKFKHNVWFINRYGEMRFKEELARLKALVTQTAIWTDDEGTYTLSGLALPISQILNCSVDNQVLFPKGKTLPWSKVPPTLRDYQAESVEALLNARHGAVSLATGLGKSLIILNLAKTLGLKTLVVAPSASIAKQIYDTFVEHLGTKYTGLYVGAKKDYKKLFVVGTSQSFTRIEPGTPQWEELSETQVFIGDESHTLPAATLFKICTGLVSRAPYRFFCSATQIRNDGLDQILAGIIGPVVKSMTVDDGVGEGHLAKPIFKILKIQTEQSTDFISGDANATARQYLYYDTKVIRTVAQTVNAMLATGRPALVLIKEIEQFSRLLPYLTTEPLFAHGGNLNEAQKKTIPEKYWDSDPNKLVAEFNDGKSKLLVGTSCVSTGTDIRAVKALFYWQGGKSEIQVKQAIGRSTRRAPGKEDCYIFDVDVVNVPTLHRHAKERVNMYREMSNDIAFVSI